MTRTPLYKAAEQEMTRRIESGAWAAGTRLPNEFVLAEEFGVSQGTMRRALMTLEAAGLLDRKPGRGTLVAEKRPDAAAPAPAPSPTLALRLLSDGSPAAFTVHRARAFTRTASVAEAALFGTARMAALERLLKRGGARAALDEVALPEARLPALDEEGATDFRALLSDHGLNVARVDLAIGADTATMSEAVALACDRGAALLLLTETALDASGAPLAQRRMRVLAQGLHVAPEG